MRTYYTNFSNEMKQQFFTHDYKILDKFVEAYAPKTEWAVDPYGGEGHLLKLNCLKNKKTLCIDIDESLSPDVVSDSFTLLKVPDSCLIITNPPYAYRHILQKHNPKYYKIIKEARYVDLYEYSIRCIISQIGLRPMFILVPENFVASRETRLRGELCKHIKAIQIHSTSLCKDTNTPTVMAHVDENEHNSTHLWIDMKEVGTIVITADGIRPKLKQTRNYVDFGIKAGQTDKQRETSILLQAVDGGTYENRIKLCRVYEKFDTNIFYNKISDRAYIQIVPNTDLSERQINKLIDGFNKFVDHWRNKTYGLGLTSFRDSKDGWRRKRIDFKLARIIINNIISKTLSP